MAWGPERSYGTHKEKKERSKHGRMNRKRAAIDQGWLEEAAERSEARLRSMDPDTLGPAARRLLKALPD